MTFQILENGEPVANLAAGGSKRDAEVFAFAHAFNVSQEVANDIAPPMLLDKDYDYGQGEVMCMQISERFDIPESFDFSNVW